MTVPTINFTTGPATLPDIGELSYNGCEFSPLFATTVSGNVVKDAAQRTTKYMEYTISVDGFVTLPAGAVSVSPTMVTLRNLLTAQAGTLIYKGRGCDLIINLPGDAGIKDVAWGPVPELLEFQPLGGGLSAKILWQVKVRIPEVLSKVEFGSLAMLQFNYETTVTYDEDGYSTLAVKGTLEIPLTRTPTQKIRTLTQTADDLRGVIEKRIMIGIDLSQFRMTRRNFSLSRDKRTLEWDFQAEEKPYMGLPPGCTIARGTYSVRPANAGMGLAKWLCTLRATYTVRADRPKRIAWLAFLALLRWRMLHSINSNTFINGFAGTAAVRKGLRIIAEPPPAVTEGTPIQSLFNTIIKKQDKLVKDSIQAWLMDFNIDEGLYIDSKTVSFSATWRLVTTFSYILLASGLWSKLPEKDAVGKNLWATTMRDISGSQSWLQNRADPKLDIIVDFGS